MTKLTRRSKKGFTLVELIVVIAIIGVLAAIIVPTTLHFVNQGRDEAANTELTNIRDAVNNGITLNPEYTAENIREILEAAGITSLDENTITITIDADANAITITSNYGGGISANAIPLPAGTVIAADEVVTVGPNGITGGEAQETP